MDASDFGKLSAALLTGILLSSCAGSPARDASAGTGSRTLARAEVDGLLLGKGMGMAAVAEINGYPGPQHVLDLKDELDLTPDQRFATSRLVGLVQGRARALGQRIVDTERRLDADMAEGTLSSDQVRARLETIAALRAQLRFTHIHAHIEQKKILDPAQIRRYYELRGRDIVLAAPAMPAPPTEPLALPAATPIPPVKALPTPAKKKEAASPERPETEMPVQAPAMTPGMQDALPEATAIEPATIREKNVAEPEPVREPPAYPLTPLKETQPRALLPAPLEETVPEAAPAEDAPPAEKMPPLTPGMQDALPDAAPIETAPVPQEMEAAEPEPVREPPAYPLTPLEEAQPRALLPEPAKDTTTEETPAMTPGMQDALPDAEPRQTPPAYPSTPRLEETQTQGLSPEVAEPVEDETPSGGSTEVDPAPDDGDRPALSPGMQDAMEFAEPVIDDTGAKTRTAPEKDNDGYELQELEAIDPQEPAAVDLENRTPPAAH